MNEWSNDTTNCYYYNTLRTNAGVLLKIHSQSSQYLTRLLIPIFIPNFRKVECVVVYVNVCLGICLYGRKITWSHVKIFRYFCPLVTIYIQVLCINRVFLFFSLSFFPFHDFWHDILRPIHKKGAKIVAYSERTQERNESRQVQLIREYGFNPRSKVQVEDGALLPRKFEPFPDNMYGRPLEEIDQFIYEEVSRTVLNLFLILLMWPNLMRI